MSLPSTPYPPQGVLSLAVALAWHSRFPRGCTSTSSHSHLPGANPTSNGLAPPLTALAWLLEKWFEHAPLRTQPWPAHASRMWVVGGGAQSPTPPIMLCVLKPTSASLSLLLLSELVSYGHLPRWPSC